MAHTKSKVPQADLLVVGSGVAGLACALAAGDAGANVTLLAAGSLHSGSSWWAQGGIAAALGSDDRVEFHEADTLAVGARLNDSDAVSVLVREGRSEALALLDGGVLFERAIGGAPMLGLEAGHTHRRILHAGGGATGELVSEALLQRVHRHKCIRTLDHTAVTGISLDAHGRVTGVETEKGRYTGSAVVLATGGYAGLWERTTNPMGNRGQGLEMAWQAGATLADLEFVQFHPTALDFPGAPAYLLSEALRGEGALLVNAAGEPVVAPLLPRDVVARALFQYRMESGPVYLSMRHLDPHYIYSTFPTIATRLRQWGLDLALDLIPVSPAAHYCMGGVLTDTDGRTDVPGLYAAGEVACTGAQGANRLASNSLLECLVFGRRAANAALAASQEAHAACENVAYEVGPEGEGESLNSQLSQATEPVGAGQIVSDYPMTLGTMLDRGLGVERNAQGLRKLVSELPLPTQVDSSKLSTHNTRHPAPTSSPLVAALAARSALLRTESRGAHYRTDYPETSADWRGRILWHRSGGASFREIS